MSDLPSREVVAAAIAGDVFITLDDPKAVWVILNAYIRSELKTEAERREAIDYEAGVSAIPDWIIYDLGSHLAPESLVRLIVDAALPDLEV